MLARIAHELYWLGRNLARAEFTARAVEAVLQAELQGASDTAPGVSFGSGGLLAMLGNEDGFHNRSQTLGQLILDPERPGSMLASIERSREGARTVRDVISAEMWQAINTTALGLEGAGQPGWGTPTGPFLASQYIKERTSLIWGIANRSMLRDEAKCFLDAGGLIEISDMVLRMLHVAMPPADSAPADGTALILLQAVGGFHAYLRAVTAPPTPTRWPASCCSSVPIRTAWPPAWTRCTRSSPLPTPVPATPSRCCGSAGWRPTSTSSAGRCPRGRS